MERFAPPLGLHLKFRIGDGPSSRGPRLGGHPPSLTAARSLDPNAEYVMTIPFLRAPLTYVSVFVNCSFHALVEAMNGGLQSDDRIVIFRHGEMDRDPTARNASSLTAHPILLDTSPAPDLVDDEEGGQLNYSSHKIGGRPYCIQEPELDGAEALLRRGYVQAVQLDFPGREDGDVCGTWPFGDGLFNLFLAEDPGSTPYWAFQK